MTNIIELSQFDNEQKKQKRRLEMKLKHTFFVSEDKRLKIFGEDLPDDGTDYSKFFKAIDEENDDGVFVAPDGSVHDLRYSLVQDAKIVSLELYPNAFAANCRHCYIPAP